MRVVRDNRMLMQKERERKLPSSLLIDAYAAPGEPNTHRGSDTPKL